MADIDLEGKEKYKKPRQSVKYPRYDVFRIHARHIVAPAQPCQGRCVAIHRAGRKILMEMQGTVEFLACLRR